MMILKIVSFILLILNLSRVKSTDNYLYAVTAGSHVKYIPQIITILDTNTGDLVYNESMIIPYQIIGLLTADSNNFTLLATTGNNNILLNLNIRTEEHTVLKTINHYANNFDTTTDGQYINGVLYETGQFQDKYDGSLIKWDFNNEQSQVYTLSLPFYAPGTGSGFEVDPTLGYDLNNNMLYINYQSNLTRGGACTIANFSLPATGSTHYYVINSVELSNLLLFFIDNNGFSYCVLQSNTDATHICKVNYATSECINILTFEFQQIGSRLNQFLQSNDKTKLIGIGTDNQNGITITVIDLQTLEISNTPIARNQWASYYVEDYSYFYYN